MPKENRREWRKHFDDRQLKEIEFSQLYVRSFAHGTVGHTEKLIIARLAELLTEYENYLNEPKEASDK